MGFIEKTDKQRKRQSQVLLNCCSTRNGNWTMSTVALAWLRFIVTKCFDLIVDRFIIKLVDLIAFYHQIDCKPFYHRICWLDCKPFYHQIRRPDCGPFYHQICMLDCVLSSNFLTWLLCTFILKYDDLIEFYFYHQICRPR